MCVGGVPARHARSAYCRIRLYVVWVNVVRLTVVQTNAVRHTVGTSNYPCARGTLSLIQIILVLVALSPLYKLPLCQRNSLPYTNDPCASSTLSLIQIILVPEELSPLYK